VRKGLAPFQWNIGLNEELNIALFSNKVRKSLENN
jgi:hypothetical protein